MQKYTSGSVLRALRIARGISQKDMAKIMGVSEQQISYVEIDKRGFTLEFLEQYLMKLNVVSDSMSNLNMFARLRFDKAQKSDRFAIQSAIYNSCKSDLLGESIVNVFNILKQLSGLKLNDVANNIGRSFSYVDCRVRDKEIEDIVSGLGITYQDIVLIALGDLSKADLVYEFFKKNLVKNKKV